VTAPSYRLLHQQLVAIEHALLLAFDNCEAIGDTRAAMNELSRRLEHGVAADIVAGKKLASVLVIKTCEVDAYYCEGALVGEFQPPIKA
jgi:hypothetical protein